MNIPTSVKLCGHDIDVILLDTPEMYPGVGRILGRYDPAIQQILLYNNPEKPSIAESNFVHEVIEAVDKMNDLKLNHTQISTLASSLHQILTTREYDYAEAA